MRNNASNAQVRIITFTLRSNFNSSADLLHYPRRHITSGPTYPQIILLTTERRRVSNDRLFWPTFLRPKAVITCRHQHRLQLQVKGTVPQNRPCS